MAQPLKGHEYEPEDEKPVTRPRLQGIEGGGDGDGKPSGDLKSVSAEKLDEAERQPLQGIEGGGEGDGVPRGNLSSVGGKDSKDGPGQVGKGFNPSDIPLSPTARGLQKILGSFTKKNAAKGGIIGGSIGLIILVSSLVQGPMQLVHFAETLKKAHLQSREDEADSRVVKIGRYIYHLQREGGGVQNVRLGVLGNIYADKIEAKLNRSGIETAYTQKGGWRVGYLIDPDNLSGTDLERYRTYDKNGNLDIGRTTKRVEAAIKREFLEYDIKTDIDGRDGRIFITSNDDKFFKSLRLNRYLLQKSGYSGKISAINGRVMAKRAGIGLHPIRKLDRKLSLATENLYDDWKKKRKESRKSGDSASARTISSDAKDDPDTSADDGEAKNAEEAANSGQETIEDANNTADSEGVDRQSKLEQFNSKTSVKIAAGGASLVGVACVVRGLADSADEIKEAQVVLPAMRIAGDMISVGSQIQSGDDIDMTQIGFFAKQLNGTGADGEKSSWNNAATVRAETGKNGGTAPVETLTTIGEGSPFDFIKRGALGSLTGAACGTAGTIAMTIVGFATGPVSAVVGTLAGAIAGPIVMNQIVDWVSGNALNLLPVGGDLGNTAMFGAKLMARSQGASTGGRELSNQELAQRKLEIEQESIHKFANQSIKNKLFNIYDQRSLASRAASSEFMNAKSLASTILSPMSGFTKNLPFVSSASASSNYDYGFKDVGFSRAELDSADIENPFKNASEVVSSILPNNPDFIDAANTCFGVEVDQSSYDVTSLQAGSPNFKTSSESECNNKSKDFLKFRAYILDTITMMSMSCLEADDTNPKDAEGAKACADLGFGSGGASADEVNEVASEKIDPKELGKNSDKLLCAAGTKDLGVVTTKYTGTLKKESGPLRIRLCQIKDISGYGNNRKGEQISGGAVVDARVSGAWSALAKSAKSDGINLQANSSFRLADSCGGTGDGSACARPGQSLHQTGLAIDFANGMTTKGSSTTSCSGRARLPGNKAWKWLEQNAEKYGIRQYSFESWHWDPLVGANRCGTGD